MALVSGHKLILYRTGILLIPLIFILILVTNTYAEDEPNDLIFVPAYGMNPANVGLEHMDRKVIEEQDSFLDLHIRVQLAYIPRSFDAILGSLIILPAIIRKEKRLSLNKNKIMDFICENPGCTPSQIVQKENIARGTIRYHVETLKAEGKILLKRIGKIDRLFSRSPALSDKEKMIAVFIRNDIERKILFIIFECEGSTYQYLADKIHMSKSTTYKYIKKYVDNDIIWSVADGRNKIFFIDMEVKDIVEKYKNVLQTGPDI
jgi:predicted transcriptional regulator